MVVQIDYDDQPSQVADKFILALRKMGIKVKALQGEDDDTFVRYDISFAKYCFSDDPSLYDPQPGF